MKKQMILVTIGLLVIAIGVSIYFTTRKKVPESIVEQLPASILHEHTAPDGTVVEHHHIYPDMSSEKSDPQPPVPPAVKQHPWNRIDLAAVRRDYQKYTVPEMIKMWEGAYRNMYGPFSGKPPGPVEVAAEKMYPRDEFLARMLDDGLPFVSSSDYRFALHTLRRELLRLRTKWDSDKAKFLEDKLEDKRFSLDMTWGEYEEIVIKGAVVYKHGYWRAKDANPDTFVGGWTTNDGTFVPFLQNTVHVYFSPEEGIAQFSGLKLTRAQQETLKMYGVAPKGVNVVYVDEHNKPLPAGTPSHRLYEQRMMELAEAQVLLQQQIEFHETMFELGSPVDPSVAGHSPVPTPSDREHVHDHEQEVPLSKDSLMPPRHRHPPDAAKPPLPEIPSASHTPDAVNRWFKQLEFLHGGQLPQDLEALQEVITELDKIRKEGVRQLKPPQRPERPVPPSSPEGSSPSPSPEDD